MAADESEAREPSPREPQQRTELRGRLGLETARVPQQDRHGLLWLGRGQLYVSDGTLRFRCAGFGDLEPGDYAIPYQLLTCLVLQPGTSLTHDVLRLCASHGTGIVAVGEGGTRFFASAPAGPNESARARRHARLWPTKASGLRLRADCMPFGLARSSRVQTSRYCAVWKERE